MNAFKRNFFLLLFVLFASGLTNSCKDDSPIFLNSELGLNRIQKKIDKLSKGTQVDSVSIRSTNRKSLLSSIFILTTDENDRLDVKKSIEMIPAHDLLLRKETKIAKDALHSYAISIPSVDKFIANAKKQLPDGFIYKDVESIKYSASPFGEKYYIGLEVTPTKEFTTNDYVDIYYDKAQAVQNESTLNMPEHMADVHYVVSFMVEAERLNIMKTAK